MDSRHGMGFFLHDDWEWNRSLLIHHLPSNGQREPSIRFSSRLFVVENVQTKRHPLEKNNHRWLKPSLWAIHVQSSNRIANSFRTWWRKKRFITLARLIFGFTRSSDWNKENSRRWWCASPMSTYEIHRSFSEKWFVESIRDLVERLRCAGASTKHRCTTEGDP